MCHHGIKMNMNYTLHFEKTKPIKKSSLSKNNKEKQRIRGGSIYYC